MKKIRFIIYRVLLMLRRLITILINSVNSFELSADDGTYRTEVKLFLQSNFDKIKGRILEVGSGDWEWVKTILKGKKDCEIISFDKRNFKNVDVVGDLYELEKFFKNESFDVLLCTDLIEHVPNPFEAIKKLSKVIKSGGVALISCPFDKELHGEEYGDYWRLTRQGWCEILKDDFENIHVINFGPELKPKAYFIRAFKK